MNNYEPKSIIITGKDAETVSRFYTVKDAIQRREDAANPEVIHPLTQFKTEEEKAILHQYYELAEMHRQANNLLVLPQLIPVMALPSSVLSGFQSISCQHSLLRMQA